jgi:hypothetical protein
MSARALPVADERVELLDVFRERAAARAYLWSIGDSAIDVLQYDAEVCGLVDVYGQDLVQAILAHAFALYRQSENA